MTGLNDDDDESAVVDPVEHPIISRSDAPLDPPCQLLGAGRAWSLGEQLDGCLDPAATLGRKLAQLPKDRWQDRDVVAHVRPDRA